MMRSIVEDFSPAEDVDAKVLDACERRAACDEFTGDARKERFDDHAAARQKSVGVGALRGCLARLEAGRKLVFLDDGDAVEVVCENARGEEA